MTADRHPCACRECPCASSADASVSACASCSIGIHCPPHALGEHLRRGLDRWIAMMPVTLGSSGLSNKQLTGTADAWRAWHAQRRCLVAREGAA